MGSGPSWGSLDLTETSLVFWLVIDVAMQWSGFIVAYILKTEMFFDLLGSLGFFSIALASLIYGDFYHARQVVVTVLVLCWATRLGSFLFMRVLAAGKDSRFDEIKDKPLVFFGLWTGQALWVWVALLPVLVLNATQHNPGFRWSDVVGGVLWGSGFACELTADLQKQAWRKDPVNKGRFINVGLWAWARYPNYGGEITLWWGIWFLCIPAMRSGYWATIVSPLFVMLIILKGSGVPLQEKQAKDRWGNEASYHAWRRRTNLLFPIPPFLKFWIREENPVADDNAVHLHGGNTEAQP